MVAQWNPAAPPAPGEWAWQQPGAGRTLHDVWWQGRNPYTGGGWTPGSDRVNAQMVRDSEGRGVWWGDTDQSYRWYEPDTKEFYEQNPTLAYQGFLDWGFGENERPLLAYARNYYQRAYAQALRGEEGYDAPATGETTPPTNGPHWTDYLNPNLVYAIRQSFNMQSAGNRGIVNQWMPAGRWTG